MVYHTNNIPSFEGSLTNLEMAAGSMRYDSLSSFVAALAEDLRRQAHADLARGRPRLASELMHAAGSLDDSVYYLDAAWMICEPHMRRDPDAPEQMVFDFMKNY